MRNILILLVCILCLQISAWGIIPPPEAEWPPLEGYPEAMPAPAGPPVTSVVPSSIGEALMKPNNEQVLLLNKIAIADRTDTGGNFFYIEEDDRSSGIRVNSDSLLVKRGDRITVEGTLGTIGGERYVIASQVAVGMSGGNAVRPLSMNNETIGGNGLNDTAPAVTGGVGPYNRGLLVKTWGSVTAVDPANGCFYIADGTAPADGSGHTGIRVQTNGNIQLPASGDYVAVVGVSSSYQSGGSTRRLVRAWGNCGIYQCSSENISSPAGVLHYSIPPSEVWWSFIGLPGVPLDLSPASIFEPTRQNGYFEGDTLNDSLWKIYFDDPVNYPMNYVSYKAPPNTDPLFTKMYPGEGYWIKVDDTAGSENEGAISYTGILAPTLTDDRYIPLRNKDPNWNPVGYPFLHNIKFEDMYATDGIRMLSITDSANANWISWIGYWWESSNQGLVDIGPPDAWASTEDLQPWHAYWIGSYMDKLALVIPSPEPSDTTPPSFSDIAANPSVAGIGTTVQITFTGSEPLFSQPTVTVNGHSASFVSSSGDNYVYSYSPTIADCCPEGPATITICGTDLAGNNGCTTSTTALAFVWPPSAPPMVLLPVNGATINTPAPEIVWAGASHDMFEIHIGTNPTDPELSTDGWDSGQVSGGENTAMTAVLLDTGITYYVFVREHRSGGWSNWSAPEHAFTISLQVPPMPMAVPYCP